MVVSRAHPLLASFKALLLLVLLAGQHVLGLHLSGWLPETGTWTKFVGKFCFDYDVSGKTAGLLSFSVNGNVLDGNRENGHFYLFIYSDESTHWAQAEREWDELTCEEMLHFASFAMPLSPLTGEISKSLPVHERLRPRFWYFTFAACGVTFVEPVSYDIRAQNPKMGFQQEFGLDEEGVLMLHLVEAVCFLGLATLIRRRARRASSGEAMRSRPILRLLLFSVGFSAVAAVLRSIHFAIFAFDGDGWGMFDVLATMSVCGAKGMIALLLMLTAKGWSLFYGRADILQRWMTVFFLGLILMVSACCEIHADWALDWSDSMYLYESWSGTTILLLNMILFAEASRSMYETYQMEDSEEVRGFYLQIYGAACLYFVSLPLLCMLSSLFAPWVRLKYVNRTEVFTRLAATLALAYCLRPSHLDAMLHGRLEEGFDPERERGDKEEDDSICTSQYDDDTAALD